MLRKMANSVDAKAAQLICGDIFKKPKIAEPIFVRDLKVFKTKRSIRRKNQERKDCL